MHNKTKEGFKLRLLIFLAGIFQISNCTCTAFQTQLQLGFQSLVANTKTPATSSATFKSTKMMYMSLTDTNESMIGQEVSVNGMRKSLASSFVISMEDAQLDEHSSSKDTSTSTSTNTLGSFKWTFSPIDQINSQMGNGIKGGVGSQAINAMNAEISVGGGFDLQCTIEESGVIVEMQVEDAVEAMSIIDKDSIHELAAILSRVMVQSTLKNFSNRQDITITVPNTNGATGGYTETYPVADLMKPSGHAPLFADILPNDTNFDTIEMSDMVDSKGSPCGYLPRPLLHKFNVLHRGIGVVVCRDAHIEQHGGARTGSQEKAFPDVYVHQRTDTKRIFPSLYDMFVGGVATAGEGLKLTAEREVREELNLTRPSLSGPLFQCTICTSYNRCVVTCYTHKFDSALDKVSWQEEEVQWGDFVEYDVVRKSGALSIDRLLQGNKWPGSDSDAIEVLNVVGDETISRDEDNWDYVPDGLLVWIAWSQWLQSKE